MNSLVTDIFDHNTDLPNSVVQQKNTDSGSEILRPAVEAPQDFITHYDAFNFELFAGQLSDCIGVYTRKGRTLGYYAPDRLERTTGEKCPEIALNPAYLALLHPIAAASVLVHEMAHHWRRTRGPVDKKGKRGSLGYHCKSWGNKMKQIGLYPSNTGKPGGKETGQQMMHYIIAGGPFDVLATKLFDQGLRFHWHDAVDFAPANEFDRKNPFETERQRARPVIRKKNTRASFICPTKGCGLKAWAKPSALLKCGHCNVLMRSADSKSTHLTKTNNLRSRNGANLKTGGRGS